jgi:hypothetical protein
VQRQRSFSSVVQNYFGFNPLLLATEAVCCCNKN